MSPGLESPSSGNPGASAACRSPEKEIAIPMLASLIATAVVVLLVVLFLFKSLNYIGPTELGLVTKRFGKKISDGSVVAMNGEAGFQHELLMPGWRFKVWPINAVGKYPWTQVPAGEIGVVIAQVGEPLPVGAKSAQFKDAFGDFRDVKAFLDNGGQKGVQRPVLPPGTLAPIHPVAFIVITSDQVYGEPVSNDLPVTRDGQLTFGSFGLSQEQLAVVTIEPRDGKDMIGVVFTKDGDPLPKGDIAGRLGGYADIAALEADHGSEAEIISALRGGMNELHNNYQNFQAFLDNGGKIGLQHDPLLAGTYLLNPFLIRVEMIEMLVIEQGQVAVIKSYVGLATEDTSGEDFKFGSIAKPGHQGIWSEPLRTGKYALNPHIYKAEIVPTSILTLNWADATSEAHNLDASLSPIDSKSREGFPFTIDLQVQIHVPDTKAPKVISMVGTMQNLVNEVLQSAVGNYFRNTLQGLPAVEFIETRDVVQGNAERYIMDYLSRYEVETRGVYIQDVDLPEDLVRVLQAREIANQQKATYRQEKEAQDTRIETERSKGTADKQSELAASQVAVDIAKNVADARKAEADGEATYTRETGLAGAAVVEAEGKARAAGYDAQVEAIGPSATALVAVAREVSTGHVKVVPDTLVVGSGGSIEGLAARLIGVVGTDGEGTAPARPADKPPVVERTDDKAPPAPPPGVAG